MAKDINKRRFDQGTQQKLEIFRECFREWFPVFLYHNTIKHIFVYDLFAGSGEDSIGNSGSPLILLEEARGEDFSHCKHFGEDNSPAITFGFNEFKKTKSNTLKSKIKHHFEACRIGCPLNKCVFEDNCHVGNYDFQDIEQSLVFNRILANPKYGKFILLDQYGFKYVNEETFLKLVNSPKTDFIFFIASSAVKRFKEMPAVTSYLHINNVSFDEKKPNECHNVIADYFRSLVPAEKEYYIHNFTFKKGASYYGLILGTSHTLGMEKFIKVCWKQDTFAGESNCNTYNDFERGTLFYQEGASVKKNIVIKEIEELILGGKIRDNVTGLKYALSRGCEPRIFVDAISELINNGQIKKPEQFNRAATNIHKVKVYNIF